MYFFLYPKKVIIVPNHINSYQVCSKQSPLPQYIYAGLGMLKVLRQQRWSKIITVCKMRVNKNNVLMLWSIETQTNREPHNKLPNSLLIGDVPTISEEI